LWIVACVAVTGFLGRKMDAATVFFPWLVVANYLVMSLGMAIDAKGIGWPEELLHRPSVWAYYAVVAWAGAGLYRLWIGDRAPSGKLERVGCPLLAVLCLVFPFSYAKNLETMSVWPSCSNFKVMNGLPLSVMKAIGFAKNQTQSGEILQDSEGDPHFIITALAERPAYVIDSFFGNKKPEELDRRLEEMRAFKALSDPAEVKAFAQAKKISWYLLRPETKIAWPESFLKSASFQADGCRLFHFAECAGR